MSHAVGTYLGSVRTLNDLRRRCVCPDGDDCWHFRRAHGGAPRPGQTAKVWVHGVGSRTVTQAAWLLAGNLGPAPGALVARTCPSGDCANPAHMAEMLRRALTDRYPVRPYQSQGAQAAGVVRRKVPPWAFYRVADYSRTAAELAAEFGCSAGCINAIRSRVRRQGAQT